MAQNAILAGALVAGGVYLYTRAPSPPKQYPLTRLLPPTLSVLPNEGSSLPLGPTHLAPPTLGVLPYQGSSLPLGPTHLAPPTLGVLPYEGSSLPLGPTHLDPPTLQQAPTGLRFPSTQLQWPLTSTTPGKVLTRKR